MLPQKRRQRRRRNQVPTTQRTPLGYRDFSYASGNNATIGPYKVPLVQNLKRPPPTQQRVLPSKEQRVLDLLAQQTQSTKYRRTSGFNTSTPEPNMRVNTHDINNHSHQPTERRLTWEDEKVPVPGLNLKIDGNQSFQTNAEKWAQSEATEINSLIRSGAAISPIYDGPVQSERNESSRHINIRSHALRHEADFFTKQLPTPLYDQARRDLDANESYSN
jgi:hypothetical protein